MEGMNESIALLSPLLEPIHGVLSAIQWILGGVFGIYLVILIHNWWKNKQILKEIKGLRAEIGEMREELSALTEKKKKGESKTEKI